MPRTGPDISARTLPPTTLFVHASLTWAHSFTARERFAAPQSAAGHDKTAIKKHVTRPIGGNLLDSRVHPNLISPRYSYSIFIPLIPISPLYLTTLQQPFLQQLLQLHKFVFKFVILPEILPFYPNKYIYIYNIHSNLSSPNNHVRTDIEQGEQSL